MTVPRAGFIIVLLTLGLSAPHTAQAQLVSRFQNDDTGAGQFALRLARRALDAYCLRRERLTAPTDLPWLLRSRGGVFVSAMDKRGAPRCCMGSLYPRSGNLATDIIAAATIAAAHDQRFKPLQPAELPCLRVIVSVLDPPDPIMDPYCLDPITDGLAVRGALRTGVVLPGETGLIERFVQWGRIRAGAGAGETVEYLKIRAIRFVEPATDARRRRCRVVAHNVQHTHQTITPSPSPSVRGETTRTGALPRRGVREP